LKHIVHIIPENSSSLDFTMPIFWKNSQSKNPEFKFSVIFFYLNKNAVLKHSKFYEQIAIESGVTFYDLSDFLLLPAILKQSVRKLYDYSSTDKIYISDYFNYFKENYLLWPFPLFSYLFKQYGSRKCLQTFMISILNRVAKIILACSFSMKRVIDELKISALMFDNRGRKTFFAAKDFFQTVQDLKIPVMLIPHGAHYRTPESEYCQFLPDKIDLPDYCSHWMPFKFGAPWLNNNTPKNQFKYVGYPGMDKDWIKFIKSKRNDTKDNEQITILYIIRRYVDKKNPIFKNLDYYIVDKSEIFFPLTEIINYIKENNIDANIIVKPHPKNSLKELKNDFKSLDYQNIEISGEPIYKLVLNTDIVLALHSTILFIPILVEIPTIIINNTLHEKVITKWPVLEDLYNKLSFFIYKNNDLQNMFSKTMDLHFSNKKDSCKNDIEHVYNYYTLTSADFALQDLCEVVS